MGLKAKLSNVLKQTASVVNRVADKINAPKESLKVIIAGSRRIEDYGFVRQAIAASGMKPTEVVCGEARGVDQLGKLWAEDNSIAVKSMPADWGLHGKYAGMLRNHEMAKYADALIAIWDGESKGTNNMIEHATRLGLRVFVILWPDGKEFGVVRLEK